MRGNVKYKGYDLEVEYESTPYSPGRMYMNNGDPGYPEEGGEFYITQVFINGTEITDLFDDNFEDIEQEYLNQQ